MTAILGPEIPLLLGESTVYYLNSAVLAVGAIVLVLYGLTRTGETRKIILIGSIPLASMTLAYLLMGEGVFMVETEGREQSFVRFIGYSFALVAAAHIIQRAINLSRIQFLKVSGVFLVVLYAAPVSWVSPGVLNTIMTVFSLLAYLGAVYLLFGPLTVIAGQVSGERQLFYAKLRNLFVLCYGCLILTSAASEQALAIVDTFVGQFAAGYIDLILMYGIGLLVVSSPSILAGEVESQETASTKSTTSDRGD